MKIPKKCNKIIGLTITCSYIWLVSIHQNVHIDQTYILQEFCENMYYQTHFCDMFSDIGQYFPSAQTKSLKIKNTVTFQDNLGQFTVFLVIISGLYIRLQMRYKQKQQQQTEFRNYGQNIDISNFCLIRTYIWSILIQDIFLEVAKIVEAQVHFKGKQQKKLNIDT